MFLHLSVIVSTGGSAPVHAGIHPPEQTPRPGADNPPGADTPSGADTLQEQTPPPAGTDGYCCGRYASYWNAFLLLVMFSTRE